MLVKKLVCCLLFTSLLSGPGTAQPIDRKALVERHTVVNQKADTLSSLSLGNGKFCFTADVTGLQSFPEEYEKGIPLGTQSEWGWHSFPNTGGYKLEEAYKEYKLNGRTVPYTVQWSTPQRNKDASNYFRENVHRLQLGNIGFEIIKKDGTPARLADLEQIYQELNMWTGELKSSFTIEGERVDVSTLVHQEKDEVAVHVQSALLEKGRLLIRVRFPFPSNAFADMGDNWEGADKHRSALSTANGAALLTHTLDTTTYYVRLQWNNKAAISQKEAHYFLIKPTGSEFSLNCLFSQVLPAAKIPRYDEVKANNISQWKSFWTRGGAVDFSGSTDPRANELERRVVLSQYLTKIQCEGSYPPQETGLTYNSWYGKPHMEMHWWHGVHFALWNRIDLLEKTLSWYSRALPLAKKIAARQGYLGARWQKMTDPQGNESPSSVGAFLVWQQPHLIYFAELCYRAHPNAQTLQRYKELVFATADFMATFVNYDSAAKRFVLGKGLIPAQERYKPEETFNPTYELAYWHWALSTAQKWRKRLGMQEQYIWASILERLSALPVQKGVYLAAESAPDSYTNPTYKTDHPSVLGTYGMLPATPLLDTTVMRNTFNLVWTDWDWKDTWGWDFPMTAMTATRLHMPEKAIDALFMKVQTNTYLVNGHNYQDNRLRLYLPGNGGLLTAVAMMCAGYDGATKDHPGIPDKGWKVRWEGLKKMP
ncbi:MAG: hypothetical protein INR73_09145 [Williamsia sp.]|nr:hypothetical protein [Williamsia sp.]